jgi:hypothetical protein
MQFIQYLLPAVLLISVCTLAARSIQKAKRVVQDWVLTEGCEIVSMEFRYFRTGPFFLKQGQGQLIYRVQVKDRSRKIRVVWLRVGHWFLGMASDKVTAIWE